MDFNWFFRSFKEKPKTPDSDKNSQESGNDPFRNSSDIPFSDGFSSIDNSFDPFQHMLFQMDDMMKKMLSISSIDREFFSNDDLRNTPREDLFRHPNEVFNIYSSQFDNSSELQGFDQDAYSNDDLKKNPREKLLRRSNEVLPFSGFQNEGSSVLQDNDNDPVSRYGSQLFRTSEATPERHFFKKFSSIRRVHLPDGVVEEHHVTSDSTGSSTTTIRRSIGDKTHEIITHSDDKGIKETVENFKNLDENEVLEFDQKVQSFKDMQVPFLAVKPEIPSKDIIPPPGDISYLSLFKKFFGQ